MGNIRFFYFGDDEAYQKSLVEEFKRSTRLNVQIDRVFETEEKKIQSLFLKAFKDKPVCVFIDFTNHTQDYLHLARLLTRTQMEQKIVTVGLVDILSPPELLNESIATGVTLTHSKSSDCFDVIFDVTKIISPNEIGEHNFAKASLRETWEGGVPVKVGYVSSEGLHFETDFGLVKDQKILLNQHWFQKKIIPSREIIVRKISGQNIYYQFKKGVDADFAFVNEFTPAEDMDSATIAEKENNRKDLITMSQRKLQRWIEENATISSAKKAKVLVIDRDFHFFNDQVRTDRFPYMIRCVPFLEDITQEIDRFEPQVIAFALENDDVTEAKNTREKLTQLLEVIKNKIQDTSPFLIVFNSKHSSKSLQDSCMYAHIMATDKELSVDVLLRMADAFEKKLEKVLPPVDVKSSPKVFLSKSNEASLAEIAVPLTILKLSETDMIVQTEAHVEAGMNIHLSHPVNMYVHLLPSKGQGKIPEYHGLIHCLGEEAKQELRRYVNTIFFRDHDAQVSSEKEEFKKLNEAKQLEKEETK
jgi:hypothetical protein